VNAPWADDTFPNLDSRKFNNISVCGAERCFFLPDSFVSCKNASNKSNFIDFENEDSKLKNYHLFKTLFSTSNFNVYLALCEICVYSLNLVRAVQLRQFKDHLFCKRKLIDTLTVVSRMNRRETGYRNCNWMTVSMRSSEVQRSWLIDKNGRSLLSASNGMVDISFNVAFDLANSRLLDPTRIISFSCVPYYPTITQGLEFASINRSFPIRLDCNTLSF